MRYMVLSFDDGRKDFYSNALPILIKYRIPATLNVISDYLGRSDLSGFPSGNNEFISIDELLDCVDHGVEIAGHSADHSNNPGEIIRGNRFLEDILSRSGKDWMNGFASPNSEIYRTNYSEFKCLVSGRKVSYIRSGNNIKRDGVLHACLYVLYSITRSSLFFRLYNKRNIIRINDDRISNAVSKNEFFFPSITCNSKNTTDQLISFIDHMPDDAASVIMLHSILADKDPGFGKDKWFNRIDEFEKLCKYLSQTDNIKVITNSELNHLITANMTA